MSKDQIDRLKLLQSKVNENNEFSSQIIEDNSFIRMEKKEKTDKTNEDKNNSYIKENKSNESENENKFKNQNTNVPYIYQYSNNISNNYQINNNSFLQYHNQNSNLNNYYMEQNRINLNTNTNLIPYDKISDKADNNQNFKSFSQIIHENYMKSKNEIKNDEYDEVLGIENNFKPIEEFICYVCSRKFQSKEKLKVHEDKSNLHKVILFS